MHGDDYLGAIDLSLEIYTDKEILQDLGCPELIKALWMPDGTVRELELKPRLPLTCAFTDCRAKLWYGPASEQFEGVRLKKFEAKATHGQAEIRFLMQIGNPSTKQAGWLYALMVDGECMVEVQPGPQMKLVGQA